MRKLQSARRGEVKALAKVHKDRDELVRIKREVASQVKYKHCYFLEFMVFLKH